MPPISQETCIAIFSANEDNEKLADLLEEKCPSCGCEAISIGEGSPGPVQDHELLFRIIISPRDIDESGRIAATQFEKVFKNGLSVCRDIASDEDVLALTREGMAAVGTRVQAMLAATAQSVRDVVEGDERAFCVYDQTVSRANTSLRPVPTHAGIFLRLPPKGTLERKRIRKDFAHRLRAIFLERALDVEAFRNGLLFGME